MTPRDTRGKKTSRASTAATDLGSHCGAHVFKHRDRRVPWSTRLDIGNQSARLELGQFQCATKCSQRLSLAAGRRVAVARVRGEYGAREASHFSRVSVVLPAPARSSASDTQSEGLVMPPGPRSAATSARTRPECPGAQHERVLTSALVGGLVH